MMEITRNSLAVILTESLVADLSVAAFGKSSAVYGHIDENGRFVRNWPVRKMAITDKSLENAGLSVKCVLLTDKMVKNSSLSVNLSEILARCSKKKKIRSVTALTLIARAPPYLPPC